MHLAMAQWLGIESPTMAMLRGTLDEPLLNGLEEDAILAIQRFAQAAGIDLLDHFTN